MSDLKQEQAVKLAEWLGVMVSKAQFAGESPVVGTPAGHLKPADKWLLSPEGQSAIMDKLLRTHRIERLAVDNDHVFLQIEVNWGEPVEIKVNAKTRQEALINAVLEMLKGGE